MVKDKILKVNYSPLFTYCDYRCEYCFISEEKRNQRQDAQDYDAVLDKILGLPYVIDLRFGIHGEFFLSPSLVDQVVRCTHHDNVGTITLVTNLSVDIDKLREFLGKVDRGRLSLIVSLHHTQVPDLDAFLDKIRLLQEQGVLFVVGCVGYPPFLDKIEELKPLFEEELGVPFFTNAYIGKCHGKRYPRHYTRAEKKGLKRLMLSRFEYYYMMKLKKSVGKPCTAGRDFIHIKNDGTIQRCVADSTPLGNILEGQPELSDSCDPCRVEYCFCPSMSYNMVEFQRKYRVTKNGRVYSRRPRLEGLLGLLRLAGARQG